MRIGALAWLLGLGLTLSGCIAYSSHRGYPAPPPPAPAPVRADPVPQVVYVPMREGQTIDEARAADLRARFDAAKGITSFTERDSAMGALAVHAAAAGDTEMTKQALGQMTSFTSRDEAASSSATTLANLGRRAEAIEIANSITSFTKRDETLAKLATR